VCRIYNRLRDLRVSRLRLRLGRDVAVRNDRRLASIFSADQDRLRNCFLHCRRRAIARLRIRRACLRRDQPTGSRLRRVGQRVDVQPHAVSGLSFDGVEMAAARDCDVATNLLGDLFDMLGDDLRDLRRAALGCFDLRLELVSLGAD
jgi:hypothetical protein